MRGSATVTSFSRKYHIRSPRSVTLRPIGMPMRSRKFEIAFFDFVMIGRVRLGVMLRDVHAGDDHGLVARPYLLDAAALPAVFARDHHDLVALAKAHATSHL